MKATKGKLFAFLAGAAVLVVLALLVLNWQTIAAHWRFYRLFESIGRNEQGLPEYRHRQTGIVMVRVPAGTFMMGRPEDDAEEDDGQQPQREVTVGPFLIGKSEVSQAAWTSVMGDNPSHFRGDDLPVEMVSRDACAGFCETTGLSIPTEAQWEYACRAGTTTRFTFGEAISSDDVNFDYRYFPAKLTRIWSDGKVAPEPIWGILGRPSPGRTAPVTSYRPNGFGLHHVHGNVWEWCGSLDASVPQVRRGGSFRDAAVRCSSITRSTMRIVDRDEATGFRVAYYPLP